MIVKGIGLFGLSPELALRLVSLGELENLLDMPLSDTVSFILLVAASLFVTVVTPFYRAVVGQERPSNVSVSPDREY